MPGTARDAEGLDPRDAAGRLPIASATQSVTGTGGTRETQSTEVPRCAGRRWLRSRRDQALELGQPRLLCASRLRPKVGLGRDDVVGSRTDLEATRVATPPEASRSTASATSAAPRRASRRRLIGVVPA